ncbi:MAG: energy transducer TonB [Chitinophagaceae bacterium]|nr:energy transducer TonB [Chitinophagaceae bacterium]
MQTNKILSAPLIDLVFDGRDKDYGAYELRKNYSKRISKAMIITLTLAALISGSVILASTTKKNRIVQRVGPEVELAEAPKEPEPLPEEPEKPKEVEPVKTEAYVPPIVVPDDDFDKPMPPIESLDSAVIGDVKIDGSPDTGIPDGPKDPPDDGKGIVQQRTDAEPDEPYRSVQVEAEYDGDWKRFLETTLNANAPVDNNAAPGRYSVVIEFVVDKEGVLSDLKALTNHGYGMEAEAMKAIKRSKKWKPAIQNGHQVKAYRKQVIVFVVNEE